MKYCPRCTRTLEHRQVDGVSRLGCPGCGFTFFDNPTPIAGVIVEHEGRILLVRRAIDPPGRFALVAGYLEAYEAAEEAAAREVREEVGLEIEMEGVVGTYSCRPIGQNAVFIVCHALAKTEKLSLGEELAEARWFTLEELPAYPPHLPIHSALKDWQVRRGIP